VCLLGGGRKATWYHFVWSFLVSNLWVVERESKGQFACKGSSISKETEQGHKGLQAQSRKKGAHSSRGAHPKEPLQSL
jgi:hypothetical protein